MSSDWSSLFSSPVNYTPEVPVWESPKAPPSVFSVRDATPERLYSPPPAADSQKFWSDLYVNAARAAANIPPERPAPQPAYKPPVDRTDEYSPHAWATLHTPIDQVPRETIREAMFNDTQYDDMSEPQLDKYIDSKIADGGYWDEQKLNWGSDQRSALSSFVDMKGSAVSQGQRGVISDLKLFQKENPLWFGDPEKKSMVRNLLEEDRGWSETNINNFLEMQKLIYDSRLLEPAGKKRGLIPL